MSAPQSRAPAPRGRGSHRGARSSFRGGRGSRSNKNEVENTSPSLEDQGEIGELKKRHGSTVATVRELFPDWTDEDVVFALEETGGDLESTIERITNGSISQWGEVSKKSDRSRSKVKDTPGALPDGNAGTRGSRGRGGPEGRARGRGSDRGRGARGGRTSSQANDTRISDKPIKPVQDVWGDAAGTTAAEATGSWAAAPVNGDSAAYNHSEAVGGQEEIKGNVIPSGKVSGWAGLFAKPTPPPAPKNSEALPPPTAEAYPLQEGQAVSDGLAPQPPPLDSTAGTPNEADVAPSDPAITLTPSKNDLTHDNLEHIPDVSNPAPTITAASTVASTHDLQTMLTSPQPMITPGMSGYAASAMKATSGAGRSSSFQRRVLEQEEPVVMPEHHAVSRAAMQFGSMNIDSQADEIGPEEDREEPETRTQLPADSPVVPRASLPPPPTGQPQAAAEPGPAARPAPGLPPAPRHQASTSPPQTTAYADQFAPYGHPSQKAYDTFGQQSGQQQSQGQDAFASESSTHGQPASTSAPTDYSAFYDQDGQRNVSYQNYYGYAQNQEVQQRSASGMGTTAAEQQSQFVTSRPQAAFGQQQQQDTQQSANNLPNSALSSQQHQPQGQQHLHQGQSSHGGYPYGYANAGYNQHYPQQYASYMGQQMGQHQYGQQRPMFDDVRRYDDSYLSHGNQYGNYGRQYAGHYNKSGMYNQPQHQYSYEHSSSPANAGGFNQASGAREAMYGRTGSTQPSESQQAAGSSAFGGMNDPFSRDQSGFNGHTPMSQQHSGQMGLEDPSKGYEVTKPNGPSPSTKHVHRPGSTVNHMQSQHGTQAGGFPPPQSQQGNQQQAAFGGYPQYGAFGVGAGGGGAGGVGSMGVGHHSQGQSNNHHHQQHPQSSTHQQLQQQQHYGAAGYGGGNAAFGNYAGYGTGRGWSGSHGGSASGH